MWGGIGAYSLALSVTGALRARPLRVQALTTSLRGCVGRSSPWTLVWAGWFRQIPRQRWRGTWVLAPARERLRHEFSRSSSGSSQPSEQAGVVRSDSHAQGPRPARLGRRQSAPPLAHRRPGDIAEVAELRIADRHRATCPGDAVSRGAPGQTCDVARRALTQYRGARVRDPALRGWRGRLWAGRGCTGLTALMPALRSPCPARKPCPETCPELRKSEIRQETLGCHKTAL